MIAEKIIPEVPKNISPEKKFSITLHMGYIYDPQKKRFSFLIDHSSKMDLKIRINQLFKISQPIITSPPQIEGKNQKEYETAIKTAIQNYLRTAIKEIYTEVQNDADPIKNFFYSGDCNLGYSGLPDFPNFLTNMPEFFQWLSECFPDGLFTEDTESIQEVINIKRGLFSGNIDIVDRATTVYNQNFSEGLVEQTFESLNIFYEKSKKNEALKTLLASDWPELKKKPIKIAKQAFISEIKSDQTSALSSFDRVRTFSEDDEPVQNTILTTQTTTQPLRPNKNHISASNSSTPAKHTPRKMHVAFFNNTSRRISSTFSSAFSRPILFPSKIEPLSSIEAMSPRTQVGFFSHLRTKKSNKVHVTHEKYMEGNKQRRTSEETDISSSNSLRGNCDIRLEQHKRHFT